MNLYSLTTFAVLATSLLVTLPGCGDPPATPAPAGCPPGQEVAGICTGVPDTPICNENFCTADVGCTKTTNVDNDTSLQSAIMVAQAGECITLAPGQYTNANLPGGVSLLGKSANDVHLNAVTLGPGNGATVQGLSVGAGGIIVDGATGARIVSVKASNADNDGCTVQPNSEVTIESSTIDHAKRYGIYASNAASVSVDKSFFTANTGAAIWAEQTNGCGAAPMHALSLTTSVFRGNYQYSVILQGVTASMMTVDIVETTGDPAQFYAYGGGMAASQCTQLDATATRIDKSNAFGLLLDNVTGKFSGQDSDNKTSISGNQVGFWAKNVSGGFLLEDVDFEENKGVSIGSSGTTKGFIVCRVNVTHTIKTDMTVLDAGQIAPKPQAVGDGFAWLDGSEVELADATFSQNERSSILIDGPAAGKLTNVTLSGGDENLGIIQQNYDGMAQPVVTNAPALDVDMSERFAVPVAPN